MEDTLQHKDRKLMAVRPMLVFAFSLLLLAVIMGAFGAHSLKGVLTTDQISSYQTAVNYQMSQSLGAILIIILSILWRANRLLKLSALLLLIGVILFSGSIYALVLPFSQGIPKAILGPVTPIGGILFIIAWGLAIYAIIKTKHHA